MSYQPKVYREQGGDSLVVASGGSLTIASGSTFVSAGTVEQKTDDFTLTASDSGKTFIVNAAEKTATLPATAAGLQYTFVVQTLSTTTGFSISPVTADAIHGGGQASTDDKDLINSSATDAEGDMVTIIGDGVDGWFITSVVGTWAEE